MSARSKGNLEETIFTAYHDIKEPLRIITSFLEEVVETKNSKLSGDLYNNATKALLSSRNMQQLIQNMLDFARIDQDKNFNPVHLGEVFELTLNNIALIVKETNAQISYSTFPVVNGNLSQLIRLMQNLLSNSIKYCTHQPEIVIETKELKNHWQFSISDNAMGFDTENIEYIFKPFKRLPANKEIHGSGLGLAICKRIVQNHSGKIWAESKPGKGSTFYFTLPKNKQ